MAAPEINNLQPKKSPLGETHIPEFTSFRIEFSPPGLNDQMMGK
jgi:hypothetical protein